MNKATRIRREMAQAYVDGLLANGRSVCSAIIAGSVAKGIADEASDVDMSVYYDPFMSEAEYEETKAYALNHGGGIYGGDPKKGLALYFFHENGIRIDVAHAHISQTQELIDTFFTEPDLNEPNIQTVLDGIRSGIPLHGAEIIKTWQKRLNNFPDKLREQAVRHHLLFTPRWVAEEMGAKRGETLFLRELLLKNQQNLLGVLYGLNRIYHPGKVKGIQWHIQQMAFAPNQLWARLVNMWQVNEETAVSHLYTLIDETLQLVATHLPQIDLTSTHNRLNMILRK